MTTNEDIIEICATTKADVRNISQTLERVEQFMSKQIEQHAIANSRLAVIERLQSDMKSNVDGYQTECTKDRNAQDKRLAIVEGFQVRQIKATSSISAFIALCITMGADYFRR